MILETKLNIEFQDPEEYVYSDTEDESILTAKPLPEKKSSVKKTIVYVQPERPHDVFALFENDPHNEMQLTHLVVLQAD